MVQAFFQFFVIILVLVENLIELLIALLLLYTQGFTSELEITDRSMTPLAEGWISIYPLETRLKLTEESLKERLKVLPHISVGFLNLDVVGVYKLSD